MKARVLVVCGVLISAIGFGSGGTAYAQSGYNQYCDSAGYCLNGWGGGPYVNAYTMNVVNNNFEAFQNTSGYENIVFTGGPSKYTSLCVSDYGNSPTDARAGLNGQCQSGQIAWGANFQLKACTMANGSEGWAFKSVHWQGGWLTPNSDSDGSPFYLNSATETCYQVYAGE